MTLKTKEASMKKEAAEIFVKMGRSMGTEVRMFVNYIIYPKRCPSDLFEPKDEPIQAIKNTNVEIDD